MFVVSLQHDDGVVLLGSWSWIQFCWLICLWTLPLCCAFPNSCQRPTSLSGVNSEIAHVWFLQTPSCNEGSIVWWTQVVFFQKIISLQLIGMYQTAPCLGIGANETAPNYSSVPSPFYPFTGIPVQEKRNIISHCAFFSCPYAQSKSHRFRFQNTHAGFERCHTRSALWKLQSGAFVATGARAPLTS